VVASPPLLPPSSMPPLLLLEDPLPDDPLPLPEPPLDPAPHEHGSGWPFESHVVVPVRDPWQEHVSICPGEHEAPAELVLHPAGASSKETTAKTAQTATRAALMFCMVTRCNPPVTADSCHARCMLGGQRMIHLQHGEAQSPLIRTVGVERR
jgi:hypothetical protein